jgi:hypothetical protein
MPDADTAARAHFVRRSDVPASRSAGYATGAGWPRGVLGSGAKMAGEPASRAVIRLPFGLIYAVRPLPRVDVGGTSAAVIAAAPAVGGAATSTA